MRGLRTRLRHAPSIDESRPVDAPRAFSESRSYSRASFAVSVTTHPSYRQPARPEQGFGRTTTALDSRIQVLSPVMRSSHEL